MSVKPSTSLSTLFNKLLKAFLVPAFLVALAFLSAFVIFLWTPAVFFLASLKTTLYGFNLAIALLLTSGFGLVPLALLACCFFATKTDCTASEFIIAFISAEVTTSFCNLYPFFVDETPLPLPKCFSRAAKADLVQIQNLPKRPPGASCLIFNLLTLHISHPGTFLKALLKLSQPSSTTNNGPLLHLCLLSLIFPLPALNPLLAITLLTSSHTPKFFNIAMTSLVFETCPTVSSKINGN